MDFFFFFYNNRIFFLVKIQAKFFLLMIKFIINFKVTDSRYETVRRSFPADRYMRIAADKVVLCSLMKAEFFVC